MSQSKIEYLVIRGWKSTQHYKRRNPPWIKLYFSWLDDPTFRSLTRAEQGDFFKLLLIATKYDHGHVLNDRKYLREVGQIAAKSIDKIIAVGLVEVLFENEMTKEDKETEGIQKDSASTPLASRMQDALPEGEGEGEGETETETETETEAESNANRANRRSGRCQSAEVVITGFSQLNKSTPSPSPETPGNRQSRKNGPFDDVKNAVEKLLTESIAEPAEIDKIALLAGISPNQVREAIKQLREDDRLH